MNQKNRITYRFDRAGNAINEVNRHVEKPAETAPHIAPSYETATSTQAKPAKGNLNVNVIPLYPSIDQHEISDSGSWNSPFQEDIGALEQLIRNSDATPAPSIPKQPLFTDDKSFSKTVQKVHIDTDTNQNHVAYDIEDVTYEPEIAVEEELFYEDKGSGSFRTTRFKRTAGGPSWFNVFLSVTGALATGALFGYLLLSLFTGASLWPSSSKENLNSLPASGNAITDDTPIGDTTNPNNNKADADVPAATNSDTDTGLNSNLPTISLSGIDQTYYLLQFGVFSNTEGRDLAIAQLEEKGLAAAGMNGKGDYRVYAGMANDRSKADAVRGELSELELYVKEVAVTTPNDLIFNGDEDVAQAFFEQSEELVRMLDELSLAQLEQPSLSPLGDAAAQAWQDVYKTWTASAADMQKGLTETTGKSYLDRMIQGVNTAADAMLNYDKKPSRTHLWTTQSGLMEAIITQKEWFETNSAL